MPQILVMGATGRIGRALRQIWGHRADVLWQGRSQSRPQADWLIWEPGQPLPKLRTLVVLAGVTTGTAQDLAQNSGLAVDLVAAAHRAGIDRVLLASSMAVYGATPFGGADENAACVPLGEYGASKLAMERAAFAAAAPGQGVTALRIANVIGADALGAALLAGKPMTLHRFADGTGPVRSYIGPSSLAQVIDAFHRHRGPLPAVVNVALTPPLAMADLLRTAGVEFGWERATASALARAEMRCDLLQELCPYLPRSVTPAEMVLEMQAFRDVMA